MMNRFFCFGGASMCKLNVAPPSLLSIPRPAVWWEPELDSYYLLKGWNQPPHNITMLPKTTHFFYHLNLLCSKNCTRKPREGQKWQERDKVSSGFAIFLFPPPTHFLGFRKRTRIKNYICVCTECLFLRNQFLLGKLGDGWVLPGTSV